MPPTAFATSRPLSPEELSAAPVRYPRPSTIQKPLALDGPKAQHAAEVLGLHTVRDLLWHLPRDRREARAIADLITGESATVVAEVRSISSRQVRRRRMRPLVEATVADHSGVIGVTFFNQPWLVEKYPPGTRLVLHGTLGARNRFSVQAHARTREAVAGPGADAVAHYPATEGLTSTQILALVRRHEHEIDDVLEPLPARLRTAERLPDRQAALEAAHFPPPTRASEAPTRASEAPTRASEAPTRAPKALPGAQSPDRSADLARRRLAFDELLLAQLALLRRRRTRDHTATAAPLDEPRELTARWLEQMLPFPLTGDQRKALEDIDEDLARPRPMQRLLMGEVGAGKTVVALYALLRAVEHGAQGALMAPTETLAEQHFATVQALMPGEAVPIGLLTGSTPARRKRDLLAKLQTGELALVVGTHAVIEDTVRFAHLATAVVDEQHRFGVRQRAALERKGPGDRSPHLLHMTATPIPRTLALAGYGDLDFTVLRELPLGRRPIETFVCSSERERARAYERIREEVRAGRQAFVVCPLVEESEALQARAATAEFERLKATELRDFELVLLHGQLPSAAKQAAMAAFASGAAQVLVATSVIEVGIDVPRATVMLVEDADRYGISQLHQLRGRIGRGEHASICLLFGPQDSSRLKALASHADGFELAEIDLELRGEGELVGTRQHGLAQFKVAELPRDAELLERARARAEAIVRDDPGLDLPEHVLLGDELVAAYGPEARAPIRA